MAEISYVALTSIRLREQVGHATTTLSTDVNAESNRNLRIKSLRYYPSLSAVLVEADGKPDELLPWALVGKAVMSSVQPAEPKAEKVDPERNVVVHEAKKKAKSSAAP